MLFHRSSSTSLLFSALVIFTAGSCAQFPPLSSPPCEERWAFFDVGETLVNTQNGTFKKIRYIPGAKEKLRSLKNAGYHLGMISNTPEHWGKTHQERVARFKKEINQNWDPSEEEFHWDWFEENALFLPASVSERKPNPHLFRQALKYVQENSNCASSPPDYYSEGPEEVSTAKREGFNSFLFTERIWENLEKGGD